MPRFGVIAPLFAIILVLAPLASAGVLVGDLNGDGVVDNTDMGILFQAWRDYRGGTPVASLPGFEPNADVDQNGVIDHADFAAVFDSYLTNYQPSATLANYLVLNVGDKRYWVDPDGIFQWKDLLVSLSSYPDGVDEQHVPVLQADEVHDQWRMYGGHIYLHGIYLGGQAYTYATEMQLPDKLYEGTPATIQSDVMHGATNKGNLSWTFTLLDVDQQVVTPAHTFSGCIKVEIVRHGTINNVDFDDDSIYWLAPGLGWVQRDRNPANPGTFMAAVQYLKVGSTEYGSVPTAQVANLFPTAVGNLVILGSGTNEYAQKILNTTYSLGGQTVALQSPAELPVGGEGEFLKQTSGYVSGIAGWRTLGDQYDYILNPMVNFGTTFTLGTPIMSAGTVTYNGNTNYATYQAVICPTATDQTVSAAGTVFQHCVVLDWHVSATITGFDLLHGEDTRIWFAPGVGIVQVQPLDNLGNTAGDKAPAVFIRTSSTTYGTQPTFDVGAAMKLAQGNAWGYTDKPTGGSWRTVSIEGAESISGTSAYPVTSVSADSSQAFDRIQSDYWHATGSQLQYCGHRPDPDDDSPTGIGIRTYSSNTQASVPQTLAMGDEQASAVINIYDSRQPTVVVGQLKITMLYASSLSMDTPAGTFANGRQVQELLELDTTSGGMLDLVTWVYDPSAGPVAYQESTPGSSGPLWKLVWARVGSNTWGGVGSFDVSSYFPIAEGNTWTFGDANNNEVWLVQAPQTVNGYTNTFPISMTDTGDSEVRRYYWNTTSSQRRQVAMDYWQDATHGPYLGTFTPPLAEPVPSWSIGTVVRQAMTYSVPSAGVTFTGGIVDVPVDFGLSASTTAGNFSGCVGVGRLLYSTDNQGNQHWTKEYFLYAPGVGPVEYWRRSADPPGSVETTYSHWGQLVQADVGGTHYPQ